MKENLNSVLEKVYATASTAGDFASKAVDSAGKKAGEVYNVSKLRLRILSVKTDMDILYKEVGKIVYAEHCDEEIQAEKLQATLLALDDKKEELKQLSEALEEAKGIKHCRACDASNPRENSFCASCGTEF